MPAGMLRDHRGSVPIGLGLSFNRGWQGLRLYIWCEVVRLLRLI